MAHPLYSVWNNMKLRCRGSRAPYKGVTVCARWLVKGNRFWGQPGFENFLADMGPRPTVNHQKDRYPDSSGNYEPNNCRWVTPLEQQRNRRNNHVLVFRGRRQPVSAWAIELGIDSATILTRLQYGWSVSRALLTPTRTRLTTFRSEAHRRITESARRFRERNPGRGSHAMESPQ